MASEILDPKVVTLWKDGQVVDGFRVVGRLVESALQLTKTYGVRGLRPEHLPSAVSFELQRRG
eukprot:1038763-Karenia_brevis.AAC.1